MAGPQGADLTLGTAMVQIGGNLDPLIAAFAKGKALRDAFERDMAANSNGLLTFTAAATDAGAAVTAEGEAAKKAGENAQEAAAKVDALTAATTRATSASKDASDALTAEAEKNKQLADMIDRSVASMNNRSQLKTSGPLAAVTAGGYGPESQLKGGANTSFEQSLPNAVGADAAAATALGLKQQATASEELATRADRLMTSLGGVEAAQVKWSKAVAEANALFKAGAISEAEFTAVQKAAEEALSGVGGAARISSTSIREMIVLLREAGRGDFTRMSGSASLLATNMGLLESAMFPVIATIGAIVAILGVFAVAEGKGSAESNRFTNELRLSGNVAGLTSKSYEDMANRISAATGTSVGSNRELIASLGATNNFTKGEIEALATAAQQLSRATGESASDILKDFEKMAEGPTKYAEEFQRTHTTIITPLQLQAIRELEARGDKEAATAALIKDVTTGIANNTQTNSGYIVRAWNAATVAVSNFWQKLKDLGASDAVTSPVEKLQASLANLERQRANAPKLGVNGSADQAGPIDAAIASMKAQIATAQQLEKAKQADAVATQRQEEAQQDISNTYVKGIDAPQRYAEAITALNNKLADSVKMARGSNIADILSVASKSANKDVQDLATHYGEAVDKIKKANLPDAYKADAKAAREAESAAKKAAREAEELAKRRTEETATLTAQKTSLEALLPTYQNQGQSIDAVNRAKAIDAALSKEKLTSDSAEGKALALLVGQIFDLNKAIEQSIRARQDLDAITDKTASIELETALIGKQGEEYTFERLQLEALAKAKKEFEQGQRSSATLTAAETKALRDQATAQAALERATRLDQYQGGDKKSTGADYHKLNQSLGGKSKQSDDLKQLQTDLAQQKKIAEDMHKDGLTDEKTYQDQLTKLEQDAAAERLKIKLSQANMEIDAGQSMADSLTSITKDMFGKQSAEYKIAFDLAKAFTIAKASLALYQDVAEALSKGFPENLPLIASAFAQGATIMSAVTSLKFAGGGKIPGAGGPTQDNIPIDASPGEFMVNAAATKDWEPVLNAINSGRMPSLGSLAAANDSGSRGTGNVTIHNYGGGSVKTQRDSDGNLAIIIRKQMEKEAPGVIAKNMASPNSPVSKAIRRTTTASPRRK